MNDDTSNLDDLLEAHFEQGASPLEQDTLEQQLMKHPDACAAFARRARLEEGLRQRLAPRSSRERLDLTAPNRAIRYRTLALTVGIAAVAIAVAFLVIDHRAAPSTANPPIVTSPGEVAPSPEPSLLPPRPVALPNTPPPGWIARLEAYVLPSVDLRNHSISEAFDAVTAQVEEIGFLDDAPEFVLHYEADDEDAVLEFRREHVCLLDLLRYLAARGGAREVELGRELYFRQSGMKTPGRVSLTLPETFFEPASHPVQDSEAHEDEPVEITEALIRQRLRDWGLTEFQLLETEPGEPKQISTTPAEATILRAALRLATSRVPMLAIEMKHIALPMELAQEAFGFNEAPQTFMGQDAADLFVELSRLEEATQVSYPRLLTKSGRELVTESMVEHDEWSEVTGEPLKIGCRYETLATLEGEVLALDLAWTSSELIGTRIIEGKEYPIASSNVYNAPMRLRKNGQLAIVGLPLKVVAGESQIPPNSERITFLTVLVVP